MIRKKIGFVIVFLLVVGISSYFYIVTRVIDPFMIDASKGTYEKAAQELLNTKQDYDFRLVNTTDKPVKLIDIDLSGYTGIEVGKLSYKGNTLNGLDVPSHRVLQSDGWTTASQGLDINYVVTIREPKMVNPKTATITYSFLGIKHKQVIQIPSM